ncbi:MAG: sulfatase-like hydrolase/transferase [Thermoanaerobaculia bacterium]|nr:MAG: sulfatase-like hydrolase/transferase [Thermoanaerobaculia bacterium]
MSSPTGGGRLLAATSADPRGFGRGWGLLHVPAVAALAIAQPLLDVLARGATFFVAHRFSFAEVALVVFLLLALPLPLALAEAVAGRFSPRAAAAIRLLGLAGFSTLLFLHALNRILETSGGLALALALALGVAFAGAYWRWTGVRQFTGLLGLALVAVPAVFFASPQVRGLAGGGGTSRAAGPAPLGSRAPVVMVVFDELPVTALMGADRRIDARRFPSFAALAERSTWFRNAVAASDTTEYAVPALLSGRLPAQGELALTSHFPNNLFTAFGRDYRIYAHEALSLLCPPELNRLGAEAPEARERWASLASDLAVVYGHLVLPESLRARLPAISAAWQGFGRSAVTAPGDGAPARSEEDRAPATAPVRPPGGDRVADFRSFVASIERRDEPSLYFLHILLPHVPWQYTPSGRIYSVPGQLIPGLYGERWVDDAELTRQGFERFLQQLQFLDSLLGELLARLESERLLDEAALIVTADHGVSFRPGDSRRELTPTNRHDVLPVPLFVKAPGQRAGRISDAPVSALSALPTLFDVLGVESPWPMEAPSALAPQPGPRRVMVQATGLFEVPAGFDDEKWRTLEEKLRLFGADAPSFESGGPRPELIGAAIDQLPAEPDRKVEGLILDGSALFENVDLDGPFVPAFVSGTLGETDSDLELAIAVNGTVRATTRSYRARGSAPRFGALLAERHFRPGANRVELLAVSGSGPTLRVRKLVRPESAGARLELLVTGSEAAIVGDGKRTPVKAGALTGSTEVRSNGAQVTVAGWAWDRESNRPPADIAVFLRGEGIFVGTTTDRAEDPGASSPAPAPARAGFSFELPAGLVPGLERSGLRVFARSRAGVASELRSSYRLVPAAAAVSAERSSVPEPAWEIRGSDGRLLVVTPGALAGRFERSEGQARFELAGWAADLDEERPADEVIVFSGGSLLTRVRVGAPTPDAAGLAGRPGLERAGFQVSSSVPASHLEDLRVFAASERGVATELEGDAGIEVRLVNGPRGLPVALLRDGVETPLRPGAVRGFIGETRQAGGFVWATGWALDVEHAAEPRVVLAFERGRLVAAGRVSEVRRDVNRAYGITNPHLRSAFELPIHRSKLARAGADDIQVVAVSESGEASLLATFLFLEPDAGGRPTIQRSDGRRFAMRPESVAGFVESRRLDDLGLHLSGWAVDKADPVSPLGILVFAGPMPVVGIAPDGARPDVAQRLGIGALAPPGFTVLVPRDKLPPRLEDVRVFAVTRAEVAAELADVPGR